MSVILIVEDNEMNLDMLARRLQKRGYGILSAVNGEAGVELALSHSPDLILMDMSLPVLDGWEATRTLRAHGASMPIIALTAHAVAGDRERCLEAGCDEYETKPIHLDALLEKIGHFIGAGNSV
jgi:CheY-like chemotaxis protein